MRVGRLLGPLLATSLGAGFADAARADAGGSGSDLPPPRHFRGGVEILPAPPPAPTVATPVEPPRREPEPVVPSPSRPPSLAPSVVVRPEPDVVVPTPAPVPVARRRIRVGVEGGASFFERPAGSFGEPPPAPDAPFGLSGDEFLPTAAVRGRAIVPVGGKWSFEVAGAWYGTLSDSARGTGALGFRDAPNLPPESSGARTATTSFETLAWSAEVCARYDLSSRVAALAGVRAIGVHDRATLDDFDAPLSPGESPSIEAKTDDILVGATLGAEATVPLAQRWEAFGRASGIAGVLSRAAEVDDEAVFAPGSHRRTVRDSRFGFGAEATLGIRFRASDHVSVTASGSVLYLDGLARADDAVDTSRALTGAVAARLGSSSFLLPSLWLGVSIDL